MISDFEVRSKINNIFKAHNPHEEYSIRTYKIDPYFYEQYDKIIQIDDNKRKNILFKIDIYFSECSLAVEFNKKGVDRDIIFETIRQKSFEKKINCRFIMNYDYKLGNIHIFIDEFKNNKIKELEDKNKRLMINSEK